MPTKINSYQAWGYLCWDDKHEANNVLSGETCFHKPSGYNFPVVRVRVIRETDYRALVRLARGKQ